MRVGLVVIAYTVRDAKIPLIVTKGCGQVGKGGFLVLKSQGPTGRSVHDHRAAPKEKATLASGPKFREETPKKGSNTATPIALLHCTI